ncbi:c-type cytochrome [Paracoccaceae bacterium GXU_MW_L88]
MNTTEINKIVAAICIGMLALLLPKFFLNGYYFGFGEHHDENPAYALEVADAPAGGEEQEAVQIAEFLAAADVAEGEATFSRKCGTCHKVDGTNGTGPHLDGVVGRNVASVDGFNYSGAMQEHAAERPAWDEQHLSEYLEAPKALVPGTAMGYAGSRAPEERANIIAYLNSL